MSNVQHGTTRWFEDARRRCVDHLRALLSIRTAHESIKALLSTWTIANLVTKAALHSACVIAYARPFTPARTKSGKVYYRISVIAKAPGFDMELHKHIMDLRNRLIAHGDYSVFPSTMYMQTMGDEKLPLTLGINVKGLMGIAGQALAESYEKHLTICANAIEDALNDECRSLADHAKRYPVVFAETNNLPEDAREHTIGPLGSAALPGPSGPSSGVADPSFPAQLTGYNYLTLRHQIPLIQSGTYTIHEHGVPQEVAFSVAFPGPNAVSKDSDGNENPC